MKHLSHARFLHPDPEGLIAFWQAEFAEHEMPAEAPADGVLVAGMDGLQVTIRAGRASCEIEIACDEADWLPEFRGHIDEHMTEFDPGMPPLDWSGAAKGGAQPDGLAMATVIESVPLGASWWRMTLRVAPATLTKLAGPHWHFRLLRPSTQGRAPVWPTMTDRGTIAWPSGDDALIDRVFTTRRLDSEQGTVSFDIYRHFGGPTCEWAASNPTGQTVGIMGPGGRGGPTAERDDLLVVGGDETAVPAILRALGNVPRSVRGNVTLLVGEAADRQEVPHAGLEIKWLYRSDGANEADLYSAMTTAFPGQSVEQTRIWFAGSQETARAIRTHARKKLRLPRDRVYSTAYWS